MADAMLVFINISVCNTPGLLGVMLFEGDYHADPIINNY